MSRLALLLVLALPVAAQDWPHVADPVAVPLAGALPTPTVENRERPRNALGLNRSLSDVTSPAVQAHLPPDSLRTGAAVVILPGGGFGRVVVDKEGHDLGRWLAARGVAAFVLTYRTGGWPNALGAQDARAAVAWVRERAAGWRIDPARVGLLGFSAGGHHALAAAEGASASGAPSFVAAVYPVVPEGYAERVTSESPPMFFAHAADDRYPAAASAEVWAALLAAGVRSEAHLYAGGGHGFGMGVAGGPVASWPDRFVAWLATFSASP
ncbi:alpha/beta hydrolase [Rubrivirga sp.]|uniref:alpha/beta hydrolase n=1 Tax=Rubrivirga sp. TaxID=1885344 RepID=UPI003B52B16E